MKRIAVFFESVLILACICTLSACDSSFNVSGYSSNGLRGYYCTLPPTKGDFATLNNAYASNALVYNVTVGNRTIKHYAQELSYMSGNEGFWSTSDASYGSIRFLPGGEQIAVYHFIDESTLRFGYAWMYHSGYSPSGKEKVASTYSGPIWKTLNFWADMVYKTYVKEGKKVIISDGTILTITDDGLIKDGSSELIKPYSPNVSF